jgi:hypothetical protein
VEQDTRRAHPLLKRLPLVLVALAGLWLFGRQDPEREIVWRLPDDRAPIQRVEIQLRDRTGLTRARSDLHYPGGSPPAELSQKARLADGPYDARIFVWTSDGGRRTWERTLDVRSDLVVTPLYPAEPR